MFLKILQDIHKSHYTLVMFILVIITLQTKVKSCCNFFSFGKKCRFENFKILLNFTKNKEKNLLATSFWKLYNENETFYRLSIKVGTLVMFISIIIILVDRNGNHRRIGCNEELSAFENYVMKAKHFAGCP